MRVFMGPSEVAGYYSALRLGLAELGVGSMLLDLTNDVRRYDSGDPSPVVRAVRAISAWNRRGERRSRLMQHVAARVEALARVGLLLWAALRCQVFVFSFGGSITYRADWELRLLRRLGRRIVFVYHGSDSRAPYLGSPLMTATGGGTIDDCARHAAELRENVARAERYADAIVVNPYSAHLHARRCVSWQAVGIPCLLPPAEAAAPPARTGGPVRVLHSPSAPEVKGTDVVRRAIASLQAKGRPIEYVELTRRPHSEVIEELQRCDLVVDQAYSDTPMAGFATEAAAYGRPAVVGSYIGPHLDAYVLPEWMPPVALCAPTDLEAAIDRLVGDVAARRALGAGARAWLERERTAQAVARRFLRIFRDDVPPEWVFDPLQLTYLNGLGEEQFVRRIIRELVGRHGPGALQLDHNPALRDRLLAFASDGAPAAPARAEVGVA